MIFIFNPKTLSLDFLFEKIELTWSVGQDQDYSFDQVRNPSNNHDTSKRQMISYS